MLPSGQIVVYDTSALVALFLEPGEGEMDYGFYLTRHPCLIGWPTLFELQLVMTAKTGRPDPHEIIDFLLAQPNITPVDFDRSHFAAAADARVRYGKGCGHKAQLNFGDCMSYAVARVAQAPLIYKGDDFLHTDINDTFR